MKLIRNSIVAKIIAVILVACILPSALFLYFYNKDKNQQMNVLIEESLSKLADEKAQVISLMMSRIESESLSVSLWIEKSITESENSNTKQLPSGYFYDQQGTLSRVESDNNISSIYFPAGTKLSQDTLNQIETSEALDEIFAKHLAEDQNISTIYYVTAEGLMRVFPYLDNSVFAVQHDQRTDLFYTVISKQNNPTGFVWTRPYFDYAGQGWVMTCSRALVVDGKFAGVLCMDMPLNHLETVFSDFRIGNNGFAFIIDEKGDIVYHPDYLSLTSKKGEALPVNLLTVSNSEEQRNIVKKMMVGEQGVGNYSDNVLKSNLVVAYQSVPGTKFSIGVQADQVTYATILGGSTNDVVLFGLVLFLSVFAAGIILSYLIARPIRNLKHEIEVISAGDHGGQVRVSSTDEIGTLANTFNRMSSTIHQNMTDILDRTRQLETILDSIGGLLFIIDTDYRLQLMNRKGKDILASRNVQSMPKCFEVFGNGEAICANCPVAQAVLECKESFGEIVLEGEVYHCFAYPVPGNSNLNTQVVMYSKKVTEKILLDRELRQTEKLAGIGNLAAAVTHELKNPLAVMKGAMYLLPDVLASGSQEETVEIMHSLNDSLERAEKIVYGLLDFSKKSTGKPENIKIPDLFDQILLLEREAIVRNRIRVKRDYQDLTETIFCDADSMKHIFLNLISNAVQAMPHGGELKISAEKIQREDRLDTFRFEVADSGVGIRSEFLKNIFKPFTTEGNDNQNTGLGLWIVQREIHRMGGEITVTSKLGEGTTFVVHIPNSIKSNGEAGTHEENTAT
jgi:two-component system, NtrC family, sensor kinase